MKNSNCNQNKLSILEKCAYGAGDMAFNLFWGLITVSAFFYTDYFGISASAAALMMLIVRCLDVAFDVLIGAVADRKKTQYGHFRPWLRYGVVPFCVIGFFTFYTRHAVLIIFALFPLIGSVIGIIALFFYNIDEKTIQKNSAKLAAMKAEKEEKENKFQIEQHRKFFQFLSLLQMDPDPLFT